MDTLVRIFFDTSCINLLQKADYIFERQYAVSSFLTKREWLISGNHEVNIADKANVITLCLKNFKKIIKRNTTISVVGDDYFDQYSNGVSFYSLKKNDYFITYDIETKSLSKYDSSVFINKYELIPQMQVFNEAKNFLYNLVKLFSPITLEVIDRSIYTDNEEMDSKYLPGWMTYFDSSFELPNLPGWVKVETLANGGHLIITTEEVFNPENPEHKERARALLPLLQLKKQEGAPS